MDPRLLLNPPEKSHAAEVHGDIVDLVLQGSQRNRGSLRLLPVLLFPASGQHHGCQQQADPSSKTLHSFISYAAKKGHRPGLACPGGARRPLCVYFSISGRGVQEIYLARYASYAVWYSSMYRSAPMPFACSWKLFQLSSVTPLRTKLAKFSSTSFCRSV